MLLAFDNGRCHARRKQPMPKSSAAQLKMIE